MERQHSAAVLASLNGLDQDQSLLYDKTMEMWKAYDSNMCALDFFAGGANHRSLAMIRGFRAMMHEFNTICAIPIIRMQLDNALRFHAAYLAPHAIDFAQAVLSRTEINKQKARDGRAMRDAVLVESLTVDYPWVKPTYSQACGFVHLSDVHAAGTYSNPNRTASTVSLAVTGEDGNLPDSVYLDNIQTFRAAVEAFTDHLNGWIQLKQRQPNSTVLSLTPPPDGDFTRCHAYLDIGRDNANMGS